MNDIKKFYTSIKDGKLQDAENDLRDVLLRVVNDKIEAAKTVVSKDFKLDEPNTTEEED